MADAEPNTKTIAFPATWNGVQVLVSATAHNDQIDMYPTPGERLEIPLEVWRSIAPFLTVAAHTRTPTDPPK